MFFYKKRHGRVLVKFQLLILLLCAYVVMISPNNIAHADGAETIGSYGVSFLTGCDAPNAYQYLCRHKNGSIYGGVAWRVFKLSSLDASNPSGGGLNITAGDLLINKGVRAKLIQECTTAHAEYLVSFGWEGINKDVGSGNYQIGPAARRDDAHGGLQDVYYASYNKYADQNGVVAKKWSEIKNQLKTGDLPNNTRIKESTATHMYRKYLLATNYFYSDWDDVANEQIPDTVAGFCYKKEYTTGGSSDFYANAYVSHGAWKTAADVDKDSTGWTNDSESVNLNMPSDDSGVNARFYLRIKRTGSTSEKAKFHARTGNNQNATGSFTWGLYHPLDDNGNQVWKISNDSELDTSDGKCVYTYHNNDEGAKVCGTNSITVKPGARYCYDLNFKAGGEDDTSETKKVRSCATSLETYFYGYSTISGDTPSTDLYKNTNGTDGWTMVPCTMAGCKIKFRHWIKTNNNYGSTTYSINRNFSNLKTSTEIAKPINTGIIVSNQKLSGSEIYGKKVYESEELTLYPGMKICETLTFSNSNHFLTNKRSSISREVCAYGQGSAGTHLDIYVKNTNVNNYNKDGLKSVYAKPNDKAEFKATYNPELQYAYYLYPPYMRINGLPQKPNEPIGGGNIMLGTLFNNNAKTYQVNRWGNGFSVSSENFAYDAEYSFDAGSTARQDKINEHSISRSDVGLILKEYAETNKAGTPTTTPSQISFLSDSFNNSGHFINNVETAPIKSEASVKVPYNFTTEVNIDLESSKVGENGEKEYMYASGEGGSATVNVRLNPKPNSLTTNSSDEKYAT